MPYSTQELIQILDQELRVHWQGQRLLLSSVEHLSNPIIAKALGPKKLSRVFAYRDFRAQVHEYQRQHQVSGLMQRQCTFNGQSLEFPELHNQLIAISSDKEKLMAAKGRVIDFWQQATQGQTLWLAGGDPKKTSASNVEHLIEQAEWAEMDVGCKELYLELCWGNPEECHCQWAWPDSGCERIVASKGEGQCGKKFGANTEGR